jgi:hypothetical protein
MVVNESIDEIVSKRWSYSRYSTFSFISGLHRLWQQVVVCVDPLPACVCRMLNSSVLRVIEKLQLLISQLLYIDERDDDSIDVTVWAAAEPIICFYSPSLPV